MAGSSRLEKTSGITQWFGVILCQKKDRPSLKMRCRPSKPSPLVRANSNKGPRAASRLAAPTNSVDSALELGLACLDYSKLDCDVVPESPRMTETIYALLICTS
jgi:hypothetical protein